MATTMYAQSIDIQGHRGARGLLPENTIPAFIYALDQGVTTLELDVVISKDKKVVVSHEPWMSADICLKPDGAAFPKSEEKKLNIYQMTYEEIQSFDCGLKGNPNFNEQEAVAAAKPLLAEVIKAVEWHIKSYSGYEVDYNIEIKSDPKGDGFYHPDIKEFSNLVYQLIDRYLPMERIVIQSFDFRVLRYWNETYPEVRLAALVENIKSPEKNLEELGFTPAIYSPNYRLINKRKIDALHAKGIKVIPWTVNDPETMLKLVKDGVDGLITDYPNRAQALGLTQKQDEE